MAKFNPLRIKKLIKETKDSVSITFAIPSALKEDFKFVAGQYITMKTTLNKEEVRRAYSICSSPNSGEITVAVKRIEGGNFSVYATTELKQDTIIEVAPPEGNFILKTKSSQSNHYLSFTAGSGVTPIMAMIKDVLETEPNSTFTLVFGNKTQDTALFLEEINALSKKYENKLFVHYIFSKEEVEGALSGRINTSVVKRVLENSKVSFDSVFLCGPEEMIHTVKEALIQENFKEENIHFELFTKSHKEEDTVENANLEGETEITILLDDETAIFKMNQANNILEAALKEDLDAPYSCKGGVCSSCLAQVTEGKAMMKNNRILSTDQVAEGYILTCEAHPTTAKITIDYDI